MDLILILKKISFSVLVFKNKSNFTAEAVRVEANLPGHPLKMRSTANNCKLDNSKENK